MSLYVAVPKNEIEINETHILPIILNAYAHRFALDRGSDLIGDVRYSFGWSVNVGSMVFEYEIRHKPTGSNDVFSFISRHIPKADESLDRFLLRVLNEISGYL